MSPRSREEIAQRAAIDIPDGSYVNLGIGIPTLVTNYIVDGREIIFHSENGALGIAPLSGAVDEQLINASKEPVSLLPGGSYFSHADSFCMIRGGHIDLTVLGAFEVSAAGDLANWATTEDDVPSVGGAMDLAVGARQVYVTMTHQSRSRSKLVPSCSYPVTALGVVSRVYTDLGVFEPRGDHFEAVELAPGITFEIASASTAARLRSGAVLDAINEG